MLAAILGLLITTQLEIVQTMTNFLPKASLFLVIAVMFMFLIGLFGVNMKEGFSGILLGIATLISLFVMYWALGPSLGINDLLMPYWVYDNWGWLLTLLICLLVWFILANSAKKKRKLFPKAKDMGINFLSDTEEALKKLLNKKD